MVATNLWHGGAASIDAATGTRAKHGSCAIASLAAPAASAVAFASLAAALLALGVSSPTTTSFLAAALLALGVSSPTSAESSIVFCFFLPGFVAVFLVLFLYTNICES